MSQAKVQTTNAILSEEVLSDEELMAVTGGDLIGGLLSGVASANNAIGNGGTPTTGAVGLVANTAIAAGEYLNKVDGGLEGGLQAVNATVAGTASQI